jgi:hypothetical protein
MTKSDPEPVRHFDDLRFTVTAELHENECSVAFKCYRFVLDTSSGERHYPEPDAACNFPGVLTIDESEVYISGSVRFDGCSNWMFDESNRGTNLHFCSREEFAEISELMARCWDWAKELIPARIWSGG